MLPAQQKSSMSNALCNQPTKLPLSANAKGGCSSQLSSNQSFQRNCIPCHKIVFCCLAHYRVLNGNQRQPSLVMLPSCWLHHNIPMMQSISKSKSWENTQPLLLPLFPAKLQGQWSSLQLALQPASPATSCSWQKHSSCVCDGCSRRKIIFQHVWVIKGICSP